MSYTIQLSVPNEPLWCVSSHVTHKIVLHAVYRTNYTSAGGSSTLLHGAADTVEPIALASAT